MKIYLETDRLLLRYFTLDDAPLLVELDSDPEVMRYITDGAPTTLSRITDEILPRFLAEYSKETGYGRWAALDKTNHGFIGWFHLNPWKEHPEEIELGYRLKRNSWGKGFATEGSAALLRKGFLELGAGKIVAKTMKRNLASQRVMQKVGLKFERDFIESIFPGEPKDAVKYSLLRSDYTPG